MSEIFKPTLKRDYVNEQITSLKMVRWCKHFVLTSESFFFIKKKLNLTTLFAYLSNISYSDLILFLIFRIVKPFKSYKMEKPRERGLSWSLCCLDLLNNEKQSDDERSSEHLKEDEELHMMASYDPRSRRTNVKAHRLVGWIAK